MRARSGGGGSHTGAASLGVVLALALLAAACGEGASTGAGAGRTSVGTTRPASPPPNLNGAWTTYHGDNTRSGVDQSGAQLTPPHQAWVSPTLDGKVYASPLVWKGLVIVATENDTVYALNADDGTVVWSAHVGSAVPQSRLPCGDIDPLGITATPVVDPATGRIFVVAETGGTGSPVSHVLVALDSGTGQVVFQESADPSGMNAVAQQERGALAIANGRVYVPFGGLYGDCGSYHGWVVGASTSGPGALISYQVPTQNEGAIWAPPGMSIDSAGNVWVATGNGSSTSTYDHGNSVIKLSPTLSELDSFAPTNWASDNSSDADLGSTAPMLVGNLVFEVGKESTGYLLNAGHLGGVGGQVFSANLCFTIGGDAMNGSDVYVPCRGGLKDVRVTANPPSFQVAWTAPSAVTGSPVVAGGLVWAVGGSSLYGLNPSSGTIAQQVNLPSSPASYSTPAVGDGLLVVGTNTTVTALAGPGGVGAGAGAGAGPATNTAYWLAGADGGVFTFGRAAYHGSAAGLPLRAPVVAMAGTPDGGGYWLAARDGGVFNYGDAVFRGSAGALPLRAPIV
ncbi:MAG TPA: PQQ-binding-like beta-propeller repeat protein, partial [Acidimicrobiales bacterium]|nr:PQQ-binding-like beta-propeller repeat protein [Acidimicrobiales bacterium]